MTFYIGLSYFIFCTFLISFSNCSIHLIQEEKYSTSHSCPTVKSLRVFDIEKVEGFWYVLYYYASSEESETYSCMRTNFSLSPNLPVITMDFTYTFKDDPDKDILYGNITWKIPDLHRMYHWIHSEQTYKMVYNTYILDSFLNGDQSWLLMLHCAEESVNRPFLTTFIMSRKSNLPPNVVSYLHGKLGRFVFGKEGKVCKINLLKVDLDGSNKAVFVLCNNAICIEHLLLSQIIYDLGAERSTNIRNWRELSIDVKIL